ncbi:MAG: VOC family protein [Acidobacteriota bacterium]
MSDAETPNRNSLNWFEIPVVDMERAKAFYSKIFDTEIQDFPMPGTEMAFLPQQGAGVGGALVKADGYVPSTQGAVVYLNGDPDLSAVLGRVEEAGGKVEMGKFDIGEHGFCAFFHDSEGNRVGLHSNA